MRPAHHIRILLLALASAALLFLGSAARPLAVPVGAPPAAPAVVDAQSVPRLSGQITDEAGVVGGGRGALQDALDRLLHDRNVQLYVAFVATTGAETADTFAQETFQQNSLGGNDLLLLVAVDDHHYAWWDNGAVPQLSSGQVDALLSQNLESYFRNGDYPGGVAAFAAALGRALASAGPAAPGGPVATAGTGTASDTSSVDTAIIWVLVGLALLGLGIVLVWSAWRRWRTARLAAEERDRRTGQLARQANQLLIQADDGVRDAGQELGFAEAEFGPEDVQPFQAALAQARDELKAAFTVRQKLDDEIPEDPPTREAMLTEVVARASRVADILGQQRQRFAELRDVERRAPEILAALPAQVSALQARLPGAEATMQRFQSYAASSWAPVQGNLEEARKRIDFAASAVGRGTTALAATPADPHVARDAARSAQGALAQALSLLDAVDRLAASLDDARTRLGPEITAAAKDVEAARAALDGGSADPSLATRLSGAEEKLAIARAALASVAPDVLAGLAAAQQANTTADEVLAGLRQAEQAQARQLAALQASLASATASVTHASDYVDSRRQGVGREARTRLAEAQRHLEQSQAAAGTDPAAALQEAQYAQRLADEAYRLASSQFDDWNTRGGRGGGDLAGAIIGGVILGSILGGGRHGGGFGGTPWGMPGGGGGFGGFGRGGGGGWGGGGGGGRGGSGSW